MEWFRVITYIPKITTLSPSWVPIENRWRRTKVDLFNPSFVSFLVSPIWLLVILISLFMQIISVLEFGIRDNNENFLLLENLSTSHIWILLATSILGGTTKMLNVPLLQNLVGTMHQKTVSLYLLMIWWSISLLIRLIMSLLLWMLTLLEKERKLCFSSSMTRQKIRIFFVLLIITGKKRI